MANKGRAEVMQQLTSIAADFAKAGDHSKAQEIRDLVKDINDNKRDHAAIKIQAKIKLEKFNGEKLPDSIPAETKEFITEL